MNNVRYGRVTASDQEVQQACKAACLHDKIKGFTKGTSKLNEQAGVILTPTGYDTKVGERGM